MQETWVQSLGQEDPLEKEIAPFHLPNLMQGLIGRVYSVPGILWAKKIGSVVHRLSVPGESTGGEKDAKRC